MTRRDGKTTHDAELAALLQEVRRIEVQSHRLAAGVLAGGYRSVFRGAGVEFGAVREYVDGDDPRSVDWNVTARVGRPFVKQYVDERALALWFVLDLSASMTGGFGPLSVRQVAARVVASLALNAATQHDQVGLVAAGAGELRVVPPRSGVGHALRIVRDALALPVADGATDLGAALARVTGAARRHAVVFLLSDFLFPPSAAFRAELGRCARRHDVVAVRLEPPELALPAATLRFHDPERGAGGDGVVDGRDPRVRAAFAARVARHRAAWTDEFRRARVDALAVPVPARAVRDPVARPLLEFFAMRQRRGARR